MLTVDIKSLIPQRDPFLFLDELLAADKDKIAGSKTYDETFPYYLTCSTRRIVPATILIESLVQCGGAGIAQAGLAGDALWALAAVERADFRGIVELPATVKLEVRNLKLSKRLVRQTGISFCGEKPILRATWCCLPLK